MRKHCAVVVTDGGEAIPSRQRTGGGPSSLIAPWRISNGGTSGAGPASTGG